MLFSDIAIMKILHLQWVKAKTIYLPLYSISLRTLLLLHTNTLYCVARLKLLFCFANHDKSEILHKIRGLYASLLELWYMKNLPLFCYQIVYISWFVVLLCLNLMMLKLLIAEVAKVIQLLLVGKIVYCEIYNIFYQSWLIDQHFLHRLELFIFWAISIAMSLQSSSVPTVNLC